MDAAAQLRFAADADLAIARPAQLKPLRGVRCQDGERRIRGRFCTERNGFSLGDARPVGLTTEAQVLSVADESRASAVLGVCSNAEVKP